ncbi:hypothetical protein [Citrobacter portucalensis]|uniref:hypothetical protein n=1 Tax=Citrobacter portucalensis TaxID=1639133 RepID=UPI001FB66395|nr:hypothetical protein [Citrobacter portucalensis]
MTSREKFEAWFLSEHEAVENSNELSGKLMKMMAWQSWQAAETDMAVQLANAESKSRDLAAESDKTSERMQQLIQIINNADNDYCMCGDAMKNHTHGGCGHPTGMFDYHYNQWLQAENKTPATDAFLAEVRAQGVEMAACALDDVNQFNYANMLDDLAQKIRQEAAQ